MGCITFRLLNGNEKYSFVAESFFKSDGLGGIYSDLDLTILGDSILITNATLYSFDHNSGGRYSYKIPRSNQRENYEKEILCEDNIM